MPFIGPREFGMVEGRESSAAISKETFTGAERIPFSSDLAPLALMSGSDRRIFWHVELFRTS
jgi:hypothetical protein